MKLEELRARLRKPAKKKATAKPTTSKGLGKKHLRCNKCGGPRVPAPLTDPDVAQILAMSKPKGGVLGAYRCRRCEIIWIVSPAPPPPMHYRCRSR